MSKTAHSQTALGRLTWIGCLATDVVLFVLANLTAKNNSHPGTASNIFFIAFVIGTALLIALAIVTAVKSWRGARR